MYSRFELSFITYYRDKSITEYQLVPIATQDEKHLGASIVDAGHR